MTQRGVFLIFFVFLSLLFSMCVCVLLAHMLDKQALILHPVVGNHNLTCTLNMLYLYILQLRMSECCTSKIRDSPLPVTPTRARSCTCVCVCARDRQRENPQQLSEKSSARSMPFVNRVSVYSNCLFRSSSAIVLQIFTLLSSRRLIGSFVKHFQKKKVQYCKQKVSF